MPYSQKLIDNQSLAADYTGDWTYYNDYQPSIDETTVYIKWSGADHNDGTFYIDKKFGSESDDWKNAGSIAISAASGTYELQITTDCIGIKIRYLKGTCTTGTFDVNYIMDRS